MIILFYSIFLSRGENVGKLSACFSYALVVALVVSNHFAFRQTTPLSHHLIHNYSRGVCLMGAGVGACLDCLCCSLAQLLEKTYNSNCLRSLHHRHSSHQPHHCRIARKIWPTCLQTLLLTPLNQQHSPRPPRRSCAAISWSSPVHAHLLPLPLRRCHSPEQRGDYPKRLEYCCSRLVWSIWRG